MSETVSTFRLYLMRGLYLLICVGLGSGIWPLMFNHKPWDLMHGVACSLLAALSALMALGIRYPLKMLPLLLFELLWKAIWLVALALPLWRANQLDANTMETVRGCLMGIVLVPLVIPWPYVWANSVKKPGDRWGRLGSPSVASLRLPEKLR
jgi:hypothetical protein